MEAIVYGRPLALYQLGQVEQAESALLDAISTYPLIAKELLKQKHVAPKSMQPGVVTVGGVDQAFEYWKTHGQHWKNTPGALDLVRRCMPRGKS